MKKTYVEKLKDPRWQRKRLEALQEAEFKCERCFNGEETLHVHHNHYFKGREPWEYETSQLSVLCESCHEDVHSDEDALAIACSKAKEYEGPWSRDVLADIINGILGSVPKTECPRDPYVYELGRFFRTFLYWGSAANDLRISEIQGLNEILYGSDPGAVVKKIREILTEASRA